MQLTRDLRDLGYSIIRGYERRKKRFLDAKQFIENEGEASLAPGEFDLGLYELYNSRDVALILAVDGALEFVSMDFDGKERDALVRAILKNTSDRRRYPFQSFSLCVSRSDFYRRKDEFLFKTLENAGYINRLFLVRNVYGKA